MPVRGAGKTFSMFVRSPGKQRSMARSIATGRREAETRRKGDAKTGAMVRTFKKSDDPTSASPLLRFSMPPRLRVTASPRPRVSLSRTAGFTLLELMIVITIVIILAAIALPQYQKSILAAREAVLREDLYNFRKLLDQYAADKGKLPQSLDELISEHYMRDMPVDPITCLLYT